MLEQIKVLLDQLELLLENKIVSIIVCPILIAFFLFVVSHLSRKISSLLKFCFRPIRKLFSKMRTNRAHTKRIKSGDLLLGDIEYLQGKTKLKKYEKNAFARCEQKCMDELKGTVGECSFDVNELRANLQALVNGIRNN